MQVLVVLLEGEDAMAELEEAASGWMPGFDYTGRRLRKPPRVLQASVHWIAKFL
ncbi:hypothetical protein RGR602_CH02349 [Rhizobium gallicum bv. gallicum R602sp]|uniref:Uncharacterized protein n=1 Tax=Rhizobium gallicum bv. gallicum R602sp TaxID=1041138 RepID=A0A0B4X4M1_9HYPH|nr:hypothetical protein RGR602_CH02349 [Rhizobium gallicum bv. gallicum R602sp]